ncbi:hypothetical protein [Micromonospora humi]|uniref:Hpr(Ser) kinase/phosphatase n=1 Tax=Micromonospora humi TaxID=745366 RepID=A0A1C5IIS1_9ACTN|nr:hypothetical protein [Micromonospora humi]SCG58115.1 hypothetical protein GA0070213_10615 [Micromonospora humi]
MERAEGTEGRSVYGLHVHGLDDVDELPEYDPTLPDQIPVHVRQAPPGPVPEPVPMSDRYGVLLMPSGRTFVADRTRGTATYHGEPVPSDVLAHPYLAPVATVFNRWAGRDTFHSGAFVHAGLAWAVIGPRTAGKSSLLAALSARGVPVLSDDILVVDDGQVHVGPRCVDLRQPVPGLDPVRRTVRFGSRLRVPLPPAPARTRLGGWLFLRWSDEVTMRPVPGRELLTRLAAARSWSWLPSDPTAVLGIATLPAWDLGRPKDWSALDRTWSLLDQHLGAARAEVPV